QGVNYIAASFVNSAKNVHDLRKLLLDNNAKHIQIISKIESHLGIDNIDEIIAASDGIMVARGDLGLEIPNLTSLMSFSDKNGKLKSTPGRLILLLVFKLCELSV
ncbi:pyruvate kinase, partial [Mycoplasmopsis bovis]|uniref:pyruvate kinase n=1 Tax=Mycoplasmopsis bovis TaxID=28903 RepID=UPI003D2AFBDB